MSKDLVYKIKSNVWTGCVNIQRLSLITLLLIKYKQVGLSSFIIIKYQLYKLYVPYTYHYYSNLIGIL